jgi:hypothetical protein
MTNQNHSQVGLGGIRSECAGGWNANSHYVDREPATYKTPDGMIAGADTAARKEPKQVTKKAVAKTTKKQDADIKAANKTDLRKRNLK